nr:kinesin heavy chain isolog [Arabidopsis thaliana]
MGGEEKILVSVRVRPLNEKEKTRNDRCDWECINDTTIICKFHNLPDKSSYTFDKVFGFECPTKQVYDDGAKEVALCVLSGINSSIFAYGQTSSGKTYTMSGITEFAMDDIFAYIDKHKQERKFTLKFSAMEIYNEAVRDLLCEDSSTPLRLLDDPEVYIEFVDFFAAQRKIGETSLNEISSRSHQILRLTIESSSQQFSPESSATLAASVCFVDLAGSERASQTLSAGSRLKEGCHINRSLLTLGTVIRKLSKGKNGHIPYRDSKLTRILQNSLGGNARTAIICTMSPARSHLEQSRNTLLFATCAKEVTTNAQVNLVVSEKALVKQLQRELARMENELKNLGPASASSTSDFYALMLKQKEDTTQEPEDACKEVRCIEVNSGEAERVQIQDSLDDIVEKKEYEQNYESQKDDADSSIKNIDMELSLYTKPEAEDGVSVKKLIEDVQETEQSVEKQKQSPKKEEMEQYLSRDMSEQVTKSLPEEEQCVQEYGAYDKLEAQDVLTINKLEESQQTEQSVEKEDTKKNLSSKKEDLKQNLSMDQSEQLYKSPPEDEKCVEVYEGSDKDDNTYEALKKKVKEMQKTIEYFMSIQSAEEKQSPSFNIIDDTLSPGEYFKMRRSRSCRENLLFTKAAAAAASRGFIFETTNTSFDSDITVSMDAQSIKDSDTETSSSSFHEFMAGLRERTMQHHSTHSDDTDTKTMKPENTDDGGEKTEFERQQSQIIELWQLPNPPSSIPTLLLFSSFSTERSPPRRRIRPAPPEALKPTVIVAEEDGDNDGYESDSLRSRNQRKRDARRAVKWGMELASFSGDQVKQILKAASLGEEVYDALMLAKLMWYNMLSGKLLREVEPDLMDTLINATKQGDHSTLQTLISSAKDVADDVGDSYDDDTETESEDEEEGSDEYTAMAARWFDGLISQNVELTKEVYSLQSVDFDRQELRKLVRKVQLVHEQRKGTTEEKQKEVEAALVTAEKSLNQFLCSMAKQVHSEQTDLYL